MIACLYFPLSLCCLVFSSNKLGSSLQDHDEGLVNTAMVLYLLEKRACETDVHPIHLQLSMPWPLIITHIIFLQSNLSEIGTR